jgi:hypothetical protein
MAAVNQSAIPQILNSTQKRALLGGFNRAQKSCYHRRNMPCQAGPIRMQRTEQALG